MAATVAEFLDVLDDDTNVHQILVLARRGCPSDVRGEVWKYLIAAAAHDPPSRVELDAFGFTTYDVSHRIRGEIRRYCQQRVDEGMVEHRDRMESILHRVLAQHADLEYAPVMVHILGPLVSCISNDKDCFECFELLVFRLHMVDEELLKRLLTDFVRLLRAFLPDLYAHMEEEELEPSDWAPSWLQYWLAMELPLPCLMRLWDTLLAVDKPHTTNAYICIAVLEEAQHDLVELDHPEMKGYLQHLPQFDIERLLARAMALQKVDARLTEASHVDSGEPRGFWASFAARDRASGKASSHTASLAK